MTDTTRIRLRPAGPEDLDALWAMSTDPESAHMAAFPPVPGPADRADFDDRWKGRFADPDVEVHSVLADDEVVGNIVVFGPPQERLIGYTIARAHWGRGIASAAVRQLLEQVTHRPLYAWAATDNAGSLRVLAKCGFVVTGRETNWAHARGADTEEFMLSLGEVRLTPWSEADFPLLERANTPEMTEYLGGPEHADRLADRQRRYVALSEGPASKGRMFRVSLTATGEDVGSVGFWERDWRDEEVYETGWAVFPEFQGRGLAVAALAELAAFVAEHGTRPVLHAFPGTDHPASNAVCRRAGFTLLGETQFEYPPGIFHTSNDWQLRVDEDK
ncbi:GNAT family N-acetyltransferase [Streptomyces bambusae]|uniref:GNAT family N-acetyltransferase n=1 Tax=Streptomyces bambusae TaxID=1550616 RepID=A0ABS6Z3C7_9ACTN|nr:GNAT family N-acetyltransferase [Streptomyces bambusae]MBW5481266.1 GNAT family N-acetyltransferase [Streptomyces bambusae]